MCERSGYCCIVALCRQCISTGRRPPSGLCDYIYPLTCSSPHTCSHLRTFTPTIPLPHSLTHSYSHPLTPLTHSHTPTHPHSPTHLLTHTPTPTLTHQPYKEEEKKRAAQAHRRFSNIDGDLPTLVSIYEAWLGCNKDPKWSSQNYLSQRALTHAASVRQQLSGDERKRNAVLKYR